MSGCQKNKTEIMLDGQDTVSESETQDDTQAGNDATAVSYTHLTLPTIA